MATDTREFFKVQRGEGAVEQHNRLLAGLGMLVGIDDSLQWNVGFSPVSIPLPDSVGGLGLLLGGSAPSNPYANEPATWVGVLVQPNRLSPDERFNEGEFFFSVGEASDLHGTLKWINLLPWDTDRYLGRDRRTLALLARTVFTEELSTFFAEQNSG